MKTAYYLLRVDGCSMLHLLTIVSLLALSVQSGEAVKCYVCSSSRDSGCKDPFNKDHNYHKLTDCTQEAMRNIGDTIPGIYYHANNYHGSQPEDFVCVKAVTKEHGREEVVRSCTIPRTDTFNVCSQLQSRDLTFCKECTGDSCNGAEAAVPRSLLMAILPASVLSLGLLSHAW